VKSLREFLDGYSKSRLGWLHNAGDRHDTSARHRQLLLLVVALMLIAAVRARAEFGTSQALTWLMLGGCVGVNAGIGISLVHDGDPASPPETSFSGCLVLFIFFFPLHLVSRVG
jgi:hypothetical protein